MNFSDTAALSFGIEKNLGVQSSSQQQQPTPSTQSNKNHVVINPTEKKSSTKFKCPDCTYTTNRKHTLKVHRQEFCKTQPVKDRTCKFCLKKFTRNGLRIHLNQFLRQKHTAKGKHANVELTQIQLYLDEVKNSQ